MKSKHVWIPAFVFIGAAVVSLIYSIIDFKAVNRVEAYSYETIQFNYDGASDGKDPNGNAFNPVSFLTDDIIEAALQKSELTYDVNQVRAHIALENVVPTNIVEEISYYEKIMDSESTQKINSKDYHPVRYRFNVFQGLDSKLSSIKLNTFLNNLVEEYCNKFYITFKKTFDESAYEDLFNLDNYDYIYQDQIVSTRLNILMNYADSIYQEHDDFLVNGKSFKDLYLRAQQLISTDASKINNIIVLNALSKDVERLKDYYTFLIERLNYEKAKYQTDLTAITAQINDYEIDSTVYVGAGENIIKVESNSVETYNNLLARQINIANTITNIEKQIVDYTDILDKLNNPTGSTTAEDTVKTLIAALNKDYGDLQDLFKAMVEEYNKTYIKDIAISQSAIKYSKSSLFSKAFVVRTVKSAAPILLVAMFGISIYCLVMAIRKEKKL